MRLNAYKTALVVLTVILVYLQYLLWFDEAGVFNLVHLKKELSLQLQQNDQIKQQNQEIYQQVERLKHDPEVAESRARGELGMIKKGEKFYHIIH